MIDLCRVYGVFGCMRGVGGVEVLWVGVGCIGACVLGVGGDGGVWERGSGECKALLIFIPRSLLQLPSNC